MSKKLGPMVSMYLLRELFRSFVMKISFSAGLLALPTSSGFSVSLVFLGLLSSLLYSSLT
jgi:hypothetical protein